MSDKKEVLDYKLEFDFYMAELNSIEYFKKYKIDVVIGNVKTALEKEPSKIITTDIKQKSEQIDCTRIMLVINGECLYMKTIEGIDEKSKYYCAYFCYRDMLNCGAQLNYLIWEDQKRVMMEIAEKQKNKFQA